MTATRKGLLPGLVALGVLAGATCGACAETVKGPKLQAGAVAGPYLRYQDDPDRFSSSNIATILIRSRPPPAAFITK